jgi:hypothetical protein
MGFIRRPWDGARFGESGTVFGYFDVERFEADSWRPGYPNPAFMRMTERDAAWMTRIVAQFSDERLAAVVAAARFQDLYLEAELLRIMRGRRDRILSRYFSRLSPLVRPLVVRREDHALLCLRDLAVSSGVTPRSSRTYSSHAYSDLGGTPAPARVATRPGAFVCATLPHAAGASKRAPAYWVIDVHARTAAAEPPGPARVHLYQLGPAEYRVVGLERPEAGVER